MKKFLLSILSFGLLCSITGCSALMLGGGAAGGASLAMDTIRLERFVNYENAWGAAIETLNEMNAKIISDDQDKGIIKSELNGADITISIMQLKSRPTSIDVKVREKGFPNLKLADTIVEAINEQLRKH